MADTGRNPRMGFEPLVDVVDNSAASFRSRMEQGLDEAKAALTKAKDEYTRYYNRRREPAPEFRPGDMVLVDASDILLDRPSQKLASLRLGPFKVLEAVGTGAYRIELPPSLGRLHPVFPVVKLTPVPVDPFPGRRQDRPPDPTLVDGEEHYEVETVLDSRVRYRRTEYLVKWKGYNDSHNQWIPWYNLQAEDLIDEYHRSHPQAERLHWAAEGVSP